MPGYRKGRNDEVLVYCVRLDGTGKWLLIVFFPQDSLKIKDVGIPKRWGGGSEGSISKNDFEDCS